MLSIIRSYRSIERHILYFIAAEFCIQLINSAFFLILLIYMEKQGYTDYQGAGYISFRFLGVLLLAFPLGIFIKSRQIKPWLLYGSATLPLFSLLIIYAIEHRISSLLYMSQALWGISFLCFQATALPYILRNAKRETHTAAISLSYATYSFGGIFSGLIIYILSFASPVFDEKLILQIISAVGFIGTAFISRIKILEFIPQENLNLKIKNSDWRLILRALLPTLIIATGAGLTIPFISIFFYNVHGVDSDTFSVIGALAAVFVAAGAIMVPHIKQKWGYHIAVPATQTIAVVALVVMAATEWFNGYIFAAYVAVACFLIRQPFMNMAGPMTSEVVMGYVGERNREIVSALTSAIWSGSWFFSSIMFKVLRKSGYSYSVVFLITAALYAAGVIWYYFLITDYKKRVTLGLIKE